MHADDNLIESRLRQLEGRTGTTGPLLPRTGLTGKLVPPEGAEPFWPQQITMGDPSPARLNRWIGPILGIVVGSFFTHMIASYGANDVRPVVPQTATATPGRATPDATTQALSRLIAAQPVVQASAMAALRSIDRGEVLKLHHIRRPTVGRNDPFAAIVPNMPAQPAAVPLTALPPPVQILVPDPPVSPVRTPAPRPSSQIRFNGSMSSDGVFTALVEELAQGTTTMRRWRLGDTVLGGYRVAEIGLRTLKLRLGNETILMSAGTTQDLIRRDGSNGSGLSALAPEPLDSSPAAQARPAVWRPAPVRAVAPPPALPVPAAAPPTTSETTPKAEAPPQQAGDSGADAPAAAPGDVPRYQ
ncbi:MAG: hypothetical protein H7338_09315 [Candidatus Sericytochromatia bacterium]|nr:hypothetical protein [Candidatus Sericytochromatia bacterium]